jgi:hypothetical protein
MPPIIIKYHVNIVEYHVNVVRYHHCLTPDRRVELGTQRLTSFLLTSFLKLPSHRAPSREFGGHLAAFVDGTPPGLARGVRNTHATIICRPFPRVDRRPWPPGPKNSPRRPRPTIYAEKRTAGDRRMGVADSSGQSWLRSINHGRQTPPELSRWCMVRRRFSKSRQKVSLCIATQLVDQELNSGGI